MLLNIMAYFIIPVYTVLFAAGTDLNYKNFSIIRNMEIRKWSFVLWGIILMVYFYLSMKAIVNAFPHRRLERFLSRASLCLLVLTILTPYKPEVFPFLSTIHVWCAFVCPSVLMVCLLSVLIQYRKRNRALCRPFFWEFWGIVIVSAVFLLYAGMINSALEIFFVLSCTIFVRRLHSKITG